MAGEIQIGGTTFATESAGTITFSNVDSSTNRQNLGLEIGVDVQQHDADTTKNDVANTFTANQIISVTDNTNAALRVTQLGTGNALVVEDSTNPDSTPFVVDSSGNVGIGTDSPSSFNEAGLPLVIGSGSGNNGASIYSGSSAYGSLYFADGTSGNALYAGYIAYNHSTNTMAFGTGGSEAMRIDSSSNVGIGPSSLASLWEGNLNIVQPSGAKTELFFLRDNQVEAHIGFLGSNTDSSFYVGTGPALGNYGTYQVNQGTSWLTVSDERQKTNLIPIVDAINKIKQLRTVTGRFLTDGDGISRSFLIAQDFVNNFPEAVDTSNPEKYGLSYTDVIPLIVAGFKEQQTIIESQQSQIDALTARIEALETT